MTVNACAVYPREKHPHWLITIEEKSLDVGEDVQEKTVKIGHEIKDVAADIGAKVSGGIEVAGESIQKTGHKIKDSSKEAVDYVKNVDLVPGDVCGSEKTTKLVPDTWGDADFKSACRRHDRCYDRCGASRKKCDERFHRDLDRACKRAYWENDKSRSKSLCLVASKEYHFLASSLGNSAFDKAQQPCTKYERRHK